MQGMMIAALLLGSPGASADPFCDTLTRVIAAVPDNFETMRGAELEHKGDFDTDVQLGYGSLACILMGDFPDVAPKRVFSCVSTKETEISAGDGRLLANVVGKCLGMTLDERRNTIGDPYYVAKQSQGTVVISYDGMAVNAPWQSDGPVTNYLSLRIFPPGT